MTNDAYVIQGTRWKRLQAEEHYSPDFLEGFHSH